MTLCENRPEGFGPNSHLHPTLPTTCFTDVIVVPLSTWLYLAAALVLIPLYFNARKAKQADKQRASILGRVLSAIYYILVVAMLAMVSLELARLVIAKLGIGLLPFTYVGILVAGLIHFFWRTLPMRAASCVYWILLAIVMAIKVATEAKEGLHSRHGTQNNYPIVDEITDVSVMIGVEVVLAILELCAT